MRKIAFLMMAFVAACSLTACNESESNDPIYTDFASVISSSPITLYTDNGETLVVGRDNTGDFNPTYGDRTLVYYNLLQSADGTMSSSKLINVQGYYIFDLCETAVLTESDRIDYGQVDIDIYSEQGQYYLVHTAKHAIDLAVIFPYKDDITKHRFTLVLDETAPYEGDNRLHVKLCHNAEESEATSSGYGIHLVSFSLAEFADYIEGTTGITISVEGRNTSDEVQHSFNWLE